MRTAGEIHHHDCKISILNWNEKYILKFERAGLEQIFKIPQTEVSSLDDLRSLLSDDFIASCVARFRAMDEDLARGLGAL